MPRILTAHQPQYLPGPRLLHKMAHADVFVVLDHLPFSRGSFENRNKIRTAQGWQWLTVPVVGGHGTRTGSDGWQRKHWRSIVMNYHRAPYFRKFQSFMFNWYVNREPSLNLMSACTTCDIDSALMGGDHDVRHSCGLSLAHVGWRMLLEVCQKLNADTFLFGANGRDYMTEEAHAEFRKAGVKPLFQEWETIPYKQVYEPFIPDMSALDILLNLGPVAGRELIEKSGRFVE